MNGSLRSLASRILWLTLLALALVGASFGQFGISVTFAPPALPVYEQPVCPGDGYIWTPGYWAWDADVEDYYWVPGTWVLAPEVGYLWTPAWWGWSGDRYLFHEGYWGPQVGFYGGINYGFGYFGEGYEGGRWESGRFFYNRYVTHVDGRHVRNVYENRVVNENRVNRISYNGGNGGINARPTPQQEAFGRERHVPAVAVQTHHMEAARGNQQLRASVNRGRPPIAATPKPGTFSGRSVVHAKEAGAPYQPPANRGRTESRNTQPAPRTENTRTESNNYRPGSSTHARDLPPSEHRPAPNTGNARMDQKYQKQQEKLGAQQDRERQKLQQRQEQDHQRLAQQKNGQARTAQLEQKHQQQTQQLQQRHAAQQQRMQQKQQPARQTEARPPKGKQ